MRPVSSNINFRYRVDGDRAPRRPLRAFDDGRQVFIEFPRGIGQGEMPPLFVVGPEGKTSELVNYRTAQASGIANSIPKGTYFTIEDASYFSMFAECKTGAPKVAESEKIGEPICSDGGGRSRFEIHEQLIKTVVEAFDRSLKTTP